MEKVELTGWEITINENGVKMATLNHERFINFLKYNEYLEQQVKLLATPAVSVCEKPVCESSVCLCNNPMWCYFNDVSTNECCNDEPCEHKQTDC